METEQNSGQNDIYKSSTREEALEWLKNTQLKSIRGEYSIVYKSNHGNFEVKLPVNQKLILWDPHTGYEGGKHTTIEVVLDSELRALGAIQYNPRDNDNKNPYTTIPASSNKKFGNYWEGHPLPHGKKGTRQLVFEPFNMQVVR